VNHTILFFPTMRCQLKCEYCHFRTEARKIPYDWEGYDSVHRIERELTAREALDGMAQLAPYHVEFSGGEPLLWPGFREFVAGLPAGCEWATTSNTLEPVEDIDFSKCKFWTASWHTDAERFQKNVFSLKGKVPIGVSFVIRKDAEDIRKKCAIAQVYASNGIRPNILRELNPGVSWTGSAEWAYLSNLKHLGWHIVEDEIPESYAFESGFLCRGGNEYVAVMPDGQVYRCYSDAMNGKPIGRLGETIPMSAEPAPCRRPCLGCALDQHAHVRRLEVVA